jgi:hypothetical protein
MLDERPRRAASSHQRVDEVAVLLGIEVFGDQRAPIIDAVAAFAARMQRGQGPVAEHCHPLDHENHLDAEQPLDGSAHRVEDRFALGRIPADLHDLLGIGRRAQRRCRHQRRRRQHQLPS